MGREAGHYWVRFKGVGDSSWRIGYWDGQLFYVPPARWPIKAWNLHVDKRPIVRDVAATTISLTEFPKQSHWVGKVIKILFKDNGSCYGVLVRDDLEDPFLTLLQLFDGRVITAEEAWWTPAPEEEAERRNAGAKLAIPPVHPPLDPPSPAVFEVRKHMDEFGFGSPDAIADTPAVDPSMPKP